ncbi:TOPRIM nucleotidyl transferase/hydrolase domain-containing protein [Chryseobacterium sp. R2A-55]|uniref:TOPRIM nucleotidyl transferase/hydrolase domain-containing protein n=1 Tax=Chryseobacterium sp. R2A-55 TaxID=2744445 RepID=UPI001F41C591|nr:AAA family ATPase [Chryseobacterium sp. R2A-55]
MISKIHYLVGPNGTGKTRALDKLCTSNKGYYIPKQRPQGSFQFSEAQSERTLKEYREKSKTAPEQIAMALLRKDSILRYSVFQILSRKLGRNFSVEIVERSEHFKITSGLDDDSFESVTIPRYDLRGESAGLRELLILLTLINSGLSNKYFIDEPELSLHPEAQRFLKNEMIRLSDEQDIEFWLATHSPILFSPESIEELEQATFFSDPQEINGKKADFSTLSEGQKLHLEKSLLRLDSEKWLLAHSKAVIFCEEFRDKVIFKKVLDAIDLDISRHDFSIVETGGKDDFSTLHLLCTAINKPSYYIGDLDNLIESKLLDKFNNHPIVVKEMSAIATDIQQYISRNIKDNLSSIIDALIALADDQFKDLDTEEKIYVHMDRIKRKTDNSKSLALELVLKESDTIKKILNQPAILAKIELLISSSKKAIEVLAKAGFFIIDTGSLETLYKNPSVSPDDDKEKIKLFDVEFQSIKTENISDLSNRYKKVIEFIKSITKDKFDSKKYMKNELTKVLSKMQSIIIEERCINIEALTSNTKYKALKIGDLFNITELKWHGQTFFIKITSADSFLPKFEIDFSSDKGITTNDIITFQ